MDFTATGLERVLVLASGTKDDYMRIIAADKDKYIVKQFGYYEYGLKYYVDNVSLTQVKEGTDTRLGTIKEGESIVLENIYFAFDKWELLPASFPLLDQVVDFLNKHQAIRIRISGHTDSIGIAEYNQELSVKRARSVVEYIMKQGVAASRLEYTGYGLKIPIATNATEEGRRKNRRIEMKILKQ